MGLPLGSAMKAIFSVPAPVPGVAGIVSMRILRPRRFRSDMQVSMSSTCRQ
jgi:hypothetical protein